MKYIIKDSVKHQNIGGKEFIKEFDFTFDDILDTDFKKMNIAMYNFILRRMDLEESDGKMKVYYGHVGDFGYYIAEDELIEVNNETV